MLSENQWTDSRLATTNALKLIFNSLLDETPRPIEVEETATAPLRPYDINDAFRGPPSATSNSAAVSPFFNGPRPVNPQLAATLSRQQDYYLYFMNIGEYLWTLLLAFLGGVLARYFYSTRAGEK